MGNHGAATSRIPDYGVQFKPESILTGCEAGRCSRSRIFIKLQPTLIRHPERSEGTSQLVWTLTLIVERLVNK